MSKWIDSEWLLNFFVNIPDNYTLTIGNLRAVVQDAPSIDIVRCKECKSWHKNIKEGEDIPVHDACYYFNADDFCSYGEREGE